MEPLQYHLNCNDYIILIISPFVKDDITEVIANCYSISVISHCVKIWFLCMHGWKYFYKIFKILILKTYWNHYDAFYSNISKFYQYAIQWMLSIASMSP